MKKLLKISAITMMMLLMVNCSGDDDNSASAPTTAASWKLGTATFNQVIVLKANAGSYIQYLAIDKIPTPDESSNNSNTLVTLNTFTLLFKTAPVAGEYNIVFRDNPSTLAANEVIVGASNKVTNKRYAFYGTTTLKAVVTVADGKIKVVVPQINMQQEQAALGVTETFSGTLQE